MLWQLGELNANQLYEEHPERVWDRIATKGRAEFQRLAAGLLKTKQPAEQHVILARLFQENLINHIISFNWDSLVEEAYSELYGQAIPLISTSGSSSAHALWKMHGDVNDPDEPWVLPFEAGRLSDELLNEINSKVTGAIIIGYNENEPVVRERLIEPLSGRGLVTRIGPNHPQNPPGSFSDNATDAMKKLSKGFKAAMNSNQSR